MSSVAAAEAGLASTAVVAVAVVAVSTVGDGTRPQSVNAPATRVVISHLDRRSVRIDAALAFSFITALTAKILPLH